MGISHGNLNEINPAYQAVLANVPAGFYMNKYVPNGLNENICTVLVERYEFIQNVLYINSQPYTSIQQLSIIV